MEREKKRAILLGIPAAVCLLFGLLIVINNVRYLAFFSFFVEGAFLCWVGAVLLFFALPERMRRRLTAAARIRELVCWGLAVTCLLPGVPNLRGGLTASRFAAFLLCCAATQRSSTRAYRFQSLRSTV